MLRKTVLALVMGAWCTVTWAQELGTKKDLATKPTTAEQPLVQPMDLLQMLVALLIVGALVKWVLPKVIGKLGRRLSTPVGSSITVEESASFGAGQLQIVTARGRTLLLCVTGQGVNCLADLTVQDNAPQSQKDAFIDFLDNADPSKAVCAVAPDETVSEEASMSMDDAIKLIAGAQAKIMGEENEPSALDRLNRLTGTL